MKISKQKIIIIIFALVVLIVACVAFLFWFAPQKVEYYRLLWRLQHNPRAEMNIDIIKRLESRYIGPPELKMVPAANVAMIPTGYVWSWQTTDFGRIYAGSSSSVDSSVSYFDATGKYIMDCGGFGFGPPPKICDVLMRHTNEGELNYDSASGGLVSYPLQQN